MIYLGNQPVGIVKVRPTIPDTWTKPEDWPDIEALPLPSGDETCLYFLYDCEQPERYAGFHCNPYSAAELSIAKYQNGSIGEFDSTNSFRDGNYWYIPLPNDCTYAVVRLKYVKQFCFSARSEYGFQFVDNNAGNNQPCLWYYGKIYSDTDIDLYVNQTGGINPLMLERVKLYLSDNVTIGYGFRCYNVKSLILNDGNFGSSGRLFAGYNGCFYLDRNVEIVAKNVKTKSTRIPYIKGCKSVNFDGLQSDSGEISMNQTFRSNPYVKSISIKTNGLKITNLEYGFNSCYNLESIDMTGCDMSECTTTDVCFSACYAMKNLLFGNGLAKSTSLMGMPQLTHDSLVDFISKLGTVSTTTTLTLCQEQKNKLSAAEIAVAEGKGWTVA